MSGFLLTLLLSFFIFKGFSEGGHESAVVVGTVYCDTCFQQDVPSASHFISGATVAVECRDGKSSRPSFRQQVKTNSHGEFEVRLPFSMSKPVKKIEGCSVKLVKSSEQYCAVASSAISSSLSLKSRKQGTRVFSFKPLKQPFLCNQKPSVDSLKRLINKPPSAVHPDQLLPPPVLPPNPLLPPPVLPPNPLLPPPVLPPNPLLPPPLLPPTPLLPPPVLPPNPFQPPPAPEIPNPLQPPPAPEIPNPIQSPPDSPNPLLQPPVLPPNPLLSPPVFPPTPLLPPSVFPPNPFQPPPAPEIPNPIQPPSAPLAPSLPPIPVLNPPPSPPSTPSPEFPFPLPPLPFPPVPPIPGVPPAKSSP